MNTPKHKILVVDDSDINRLLLTELLKDEYEVYEADGGKNAIAFFDRKEEISLVLLDIVMPDVDGYDVLKAMRQRGLLEDIPVIMISAENAAEYITKAFDLGATDYVSRPLEAAVVRRRIRNSINLYAKQKRLAELVADQIYEKEKNNDMMISFLSHLVEFRNGESGSHVTHINLITELLLKSLGSLDPKYRVSLEEVRRIRTASSLHDIGKIAIPQEILNKPGRLTAEEFEVMKTHSAIGASILENLTGFQENPLVRTAYEICRWHHERYDGKGYPDGLKGDEIPLSAQIVSLADVYDALTSERCYKKAFSHEKAVAMICGGECGSFNPTLLQAFREISDELHVSLQSNRSSLQEKREIQSIVNGILNGTPSEF